MEYSILLTGFQGTSAEKLVKSVCGCDTLLLPSNKQADADLLTRQLLRRKYDLIISIGQRPNIKDKVHIETLAREKDTALKTAVDCEKLAQCFDAAGIPAKLSSNAGLSYCNTLYFNGLQLLSTHNLTAGMVFIHIPFEKNISEPDLFYKRFQNVIDEMKRKGAEHIWRS